MGWKKPERRVTDPLERRESILTDFTGPNVHEVSSSGAGGGGGGGGNGGSQNQLAPTEAEREVYLRESGVVVRVFWNKGLERFAVA